MYRLSSDHRIRRRATKDVAGAPASLAKASPLNAPLPGPVVFELPMTEPAQAQREFIPVLSLFAREQVGDDVPDSRSVPLLNDEAMTANDSEVVGNLGRKPGRRADQEIKTLLARFVFGPGQNPNPLTGVSRFDGRDRFKLIGFNRPDTNSRSHILNIMPGQ